MRKVLNIIFIIFLFTGLGYGQKTTTEPKLIGIFKPTYYEDIFEKLDNLLLELGSELNAEKNHLTIRICSDTPLPVAFVLAKGMPQYVIENLKRYNPSFEISNPKVIILRNNINCEIKRDDYFLTEYWVVKNDAKNLESVEQENSDDILVSEIKTDDNDLLESKEEILKILKNNRKSWLVVKIPKSKNKTMPKEVQKLQKFLSNKGIKEDRVFIKKVLPPNEKINKFHMILVENRLKTVF